MYYIDVYSESIANIEYRISKQLDTGAEFSDLSQAIATCPQIRGQVSCRKTYKT